MEQDHLYFIQSDVTGYVKIGRSKNPEKRLKALQTGSPYLLRLMLVLEGWGYKEKEFHSYLERYKILGEWFHSDGIGILPYEVWLLIPWDCRSQWWRRD